MFQCPKCHAPMKTVSRNGVQIEQCEACRGIFLDYGELEAIGKLESQFAAAPAAPPPAAAPAGWAGPPGGPYGAPPPGYGAPPGYGVPPPYAAPPPGWGHAPSHYHYRRHKSFAHVLFSS